MSKLDERRKMTKKVVMMCISVILMISIGGCMLRPLTRGEKLSRELNSDQIMSDEIMQEIVDALDARDEEKLKGMYSDLTLEEKTKLEKQIKEVINFYKGKKISFEGDASSQTAYKKGKTTEVELKGSYIVVTSEATYQVFFKNKPRALENPEETGLSYLEIIECREGSSSGGPFFWQHIKDGLGAYYFNALKDEKVEEAIQSVAKDLDENNITAIKELFALPTVDSTPELEQQIGALAEFYQGKMVSFEGTVDLVLDYHTTDVVGFYLLTTEKATYQVRLEYRTWDEYEKDKEGLNKLEFVQCEDKKSTDSSFPWKHVEDGPGVYFSVKE